MTLLTFFAFIEQTIIHHIYPKCFYSHSILLPTNFITKQESKTGCVESSVNISRLLQTL